MKNKHNFNEVRNILEERIGLNKIPESILTNIELGLTTLQKVGHTCKNITSELYYRFALSMN